MSEEEYFIEVFNDLSENIISDDFYNRNSELITSIIDGFYYRDRRLGTYNTKMCRSTMEIIFGNLKIHGLR